MSHLDEGVLHAMLDGEVESAELVAIEVHLRGCRECEARLEEARQFRDGAFAMITMLDDQPAPVLAASAPAQIAPRARPPIRARLPRWAPALAWAATILVAVGLGWSFRPAASPIVPAAESENRTAVVAAAPANDVAAVPESARPAEPQAPPPALRRQPAKTAVASPAAGAAARPAPASEPARQERAADLDELAVTTAEAKDSNPLGAASAARKVAKNSLAPAPAPLQAFSRSRDARETTITVISAAKAIEALGGSIRLVDGMTPVRFELAGEVVRVGYETVFGALVLEQWRDANVLRHRLITPRGTPADSVSAWTERIR